MGLSPVANHEEMVKVVDLSLGVTRSSIISIRWNLPALMTWIPLIIVTTRGMHTMDNDWASDD